MTFDPNSDDYTYRPVYGTCGGKVAFKVQKIKVDNWRTALYVIWLLLRGKSMYVETPLIEFELVFGRTRLP